jgi:hypothetical protein
MTTDTTDRCENGANAAVTEQRQLRCEAERLGHFIEDRFPAETAGTDLNNTSDILRLARELLERLWRWEN